LRVPAGLVAGLLISVSCVGVAQAAEPVSLPKIPLPTGDPEALQQQLSTVGGTNPAPVGGMTPAPGEQPVRATPRRLSLPVPRWFTPSLRKRVHAAGRKGLRIRVPQPPDTVTKSCPGAGPTVPGVQAGTCEVAPAGCTANFIFYKGPTVGAGALLRPAATGPPFVSDGRHWFIGTAGHCLTGGSRVYMQVRPPGVWVENSDILGIAEVGTVAKKMNGGIGRDFGVVQIYKGFLVTPALPIGGPHGIYSQCAPSPAHYYGHGYHVAVGQGKPGGGQAFWPGDHFYWAGTSFGGDSGSGMMVGPLAGGDLTHGLGIGPNGIVPLPVGFGTRLTAALDFLGQGYYLVNADGTLSRDTSSCSGLDPLGTLGVSF
jgi:hypothetical protein